MSKKSLHVVPNPNGGWSVKEGGALRASKNFNNKKDAIDCGRSISKAAGGELIIHGRDGMIKSSSSYGRDPYPPRDRNNRK